MNGLPAPRKAGALLDGLRRLRKAAESATLSSSENKRISKLRKKTEVSQVFDPLFAHDVGGHIDADRDAIRETRYQELISDIEAAIRGKEVPIVPLHANDVVEGSVGPISGQINRTTRLYYSVCLPLRRSDVSVHMTRVSGPMPAMYASVDHERPTSSEFDLEAEDGELIYHHEPADMGEPILHHEPEEEDEQHDKKMLRRPRSAIKAREELSPARQRRILYICVESSEAVCEYRLRCSIRRIAQPEPTAEQQGLMTDMQLFRMARRRLHSRLTDLKQNKETRREFDEHLQELQQKKKKSWRQDFCAFNRRHAEDYIPEVQDALRSLRRQKEDERARIVQRRHEEIDRELDEKNMWWAGRDDMKKRQKAEALARQEQYEEMTRRKNAWLEKLIVVSYAIKLCRESQEQKKIHEWTMRVTRASEKLQQYLLKRFTKQRRLDLYTNVVRCRCAMVAYVRHSRIGLANMAAPSLRWFLQTYALKFQEPDMLSLLKRFLGRVKYVQRNWRKRALMRQARVEALLNRFYAADFIAEEEQCPEADDSQERRGSGKGGGRKTSKEAVAMEDGKGKRGIIKRTQSGNTKEARPMPKSAVKADSQKRSSAPKDTRGSTGSAPRVQLDLQAKVVKFRTLGNSAEVAGAQAVPAFVRDYKGIELLPDFVRKKVLVNHVYEMQSSLQARLREWTKRKIKAQYDEDLHAMGFANTTRFLEPRPRSFELSRLKGLYSDTYDAWLRGDFKGLVIHRTRVMTKFFGIWRRAHHHVQEKAHKPVFHGEDLHHHDSAQAMRSHMQKEKMKNMKGSNAAVSSAFGL